MMKEITYAQACIMLEEGKHIKCRINSRDEVLIIDKADLDAKKLLSEKGIQTFKLYEEEISCEIPKDAIRLTIDEAFELMAKEELIYSNINGEEEEIIFVSELNQIIRAAKMRGREPILYWYV